MGVFQMGDPQVELFGRVVSENGGLSQHVFDCPSTCSSNYLQQPVTVFREHLHMHRTGASMINTHFRNGEVLREGVVEYWDFEQQGNLAVVQQPFELQPGDAFRTTCNYDASNGVAFGLGSQDEMCVGFLYYFPRMEYFLFCGIGFDPFAPGCGVDYSVTPDFSELDRSFGPAPATCDLETGAPPSSSPDSGPNADPPTLSTDGGSETASPTPAEGVNVSAAHPKVGPTAHGVLLATLMFFM